MTSLPRKLITLLIFAMLSAGAVAADQHPRLLVSAADITELGDSWKDSPTFAATVRRAESRVQSYFASTPDVPVPHDAGGGYTHEQHKRNARAISDAGLLYQWTGDRQYIAYARQLLLAYAELYPTLGEHPEKKEQTPGRLFWQSLNEAVWLVYAIQGYDAIYSELNKNDRARIESGLFRPLASFLSVESPQTFDRIHNHGTWAVAAVGMTGYVLGDEDMVQQALLGLKKDGSAGFLKQLDELFSPDGYYTEGPYYQRYALMPFVVFAKSIEQNDPARQIFEHRDGILRKAIYTAIQLSYAGKFFPLNDAIKDKGIDTIELDYGISIAFGLGGDPTLLSLINKKSTVVMTGDGLRMATALDAGKSQQFPFRSMQLRDGADGKQGSLVIMRSGSKPGHSALVFKVTSQGMGHGHFDRLGWIFYDNGNEVVTDYGAARYLNVVQKNGGHYLPENDSWAKQTIAHNALVVDEKSHFNGKLLGAEQSSPEVLFFESNAELSIATALEAAAYPGVVMQRTQALITGDTFARPFVLDIVRVQSKSVHQYDLPLYYQGQIVEIGTPMSTATNNLATLGNANGYQFLWNRANSEIAANESLAVTWLLDNRFYTYTSIAAHERDLILTEVGANDPNFNLRHEPGILQRVRAGKDVVFVSVLEAHGEYNGSREYTTDSGSEIQKLSRETEDGMDLIRIFTKSGKQLDIALSYDPNPAASHSITTDSGAVTWNGFYSLIRGAAK